MKNYITKNRANKIIVSCIAILLAVVTVGGILLAIFIPKRSSGSELPDNNQLVTSLEYKETLNDVDKYFNIPLSSKKSLTAVKENISVLDQNGIEPDYDVKACGSGAYSIVAPKDGYVEGNTYNVMISDDGISFSDPSFYDRKEITFTVYAEDVIDVKYRESVLDYSSSKDGVFTESTDGTRLSTSSQFNTKHELAVGNLAILPVYDEYGFIVYKAYRITGIEDGELIVEQPEMSEIYEELEVEGDFEAVYSSEYIKPAEQAQLENEILNSPAVKAISTLSSTDDKPEIELKLKIERDCVKINYEVKFPKVFHKTDFVVEGEIVIKAGVIASINILRGTFNFGTYVDYTNKYTFKLQYSKGIGPDGEGIKLFKNAMKKLSDTLNEKAGKSEMEIPVFSTFIPTPVPCLGFNFDVSIVFKLNLKIEFGITFTDEFHVEVGAKKVSGGIRPYFNRSVKTRAVEIEFSGSVTAKIGLQIDFSGSLLGILKAGVSFEIGLYGKIAGSVKVGTLEELQNGYVEAEKSYRCWAAYFETGIYSELSLFAEVDLLLWSGKAKLTLLEATLPIFSIGRTQQYEIELQSDSVVLNQNGAVSFPQVTLHATDMFTGEHSEKVIPEKDLNKVFNISFENGLCYLDDNKNIRSNADNLAEFNCVATIEINRWNIVYDAFKNIFTSEVDDDKRGIFHYELGAINVYAYINISKQPIAVDSVSLNFNRITEDPEYLSLHPELSEIDAAYEYRDDSNGIMDFQIGRLVEIVPTFMPQNASYKTLDYKVLSGEEYIVGGARGIKLFNKNGETYARFRIVEDPTAIGNVDGLTDITKEIKFQAVTTGYRGAYEEWNQMSDETGIFASGIPVREYSVSPVIEEINIEQTNVMNGDEINFAIDNTSVYPQNATRGAVASEQISLLKGAAVDCGDGKIKINENAEVGEQIVIVSSLSGVERQYFLNVVKRAVESVEIKSDGKYISEGNCVNFTADILGVDGETPTVTEVIYIVSSGREFAVLETQGNNATLLIKKGTPVGTVFKIFALIDGKRSNTVEISTVKIPVDEVELLSPVSDNTVNKGQQIQLSSNVTPDNASYRNPVFTVIKGSEYAWVDSKDGILVISTENVGGEEIEVQCEADGVKSNILSFTVKKSDVQYIQFAAKKSFARNGETVVLDAFVNPDATNQNILYTVISGNASIEGNILEVSEDAVTGDEITVRATASGNNALYVDKTIVVNSDEYYLSIKGMIGNVKMYSGETASVEMTGSDGNKINNSDITFQLLRVGQATTLAQIDNNGIITISNNIPETETALTLTLTAVYNEISESILIDILVRPETVELQTSDNLSFAELKPGEKTELNIQVQKQKNSPIYDNLSLEITGNINAYIDVIVGKYGLKSYKIIAQVLPLARTGETATIVLNYYVQGVLLAKSQEFTIRVARVTENVIIENVPDKMTVGMSARLMAVGFPENKNYCATFSFADSVSENYASIDKTSGIITINDNIDLVGYRVAVKASIDGIASETYFIDIVGDVQEIQIGKDVASRNVQLVPELGFYLLYPNGRFVVSADVIGDRSANIYYELDVIGKQYLSLDGNIITVKDFRANSGINATLVAYSDNGVVSNTIVFYIPTEISSVDDWYKIQDRSSGYFVLTEDIDFEGKEYSVIPKFSGILDGCGHTIKNIKITNATRNSSFGLFEENYGMIFNLKMSSVNIRISNSDSVLYGGSICAKNFGYIIGCNIYSVMNKFMFIDIAGLESFVGGICGVNEGVIRNSMSDLYVESSGYAGGIAGKNAVSGIIKNCINGGTIRFRGCDPNNFVAGIAGVNTGKIFESENYGEVFDKSNSAINAIG